MTNRDPLPAEDWREQTAQIDALIDALKWVAPLPWMCEWTSTTDVEVTDADGWVVAVLDRGQCGRDPGDYATELVAQVNAARARRHLRDLVATAESKT